MKKILYTALFLAPLSLWAQEETADEVKSVEIRVVEDYKAQVRSAHKISEQPSFADTTSEKLAVTVLIFLMVVFGNKLLTIIILEKHMQV